MEILKYDLDPTDTEFEIIQTVAEIKLTLALFMNKEFARQINNINKIVEKKCFQPSLNILEISLYT